MIRLRTWDLKAVSAIKRRLVVRNARYLGALGQLWVCSAFAQETDSLNSNGGRWH